MRNVLHILGDFNDQDIEWLIDMGIKKNIQPEEFLIEASVPLHEIYFVLKGKFGVVLPDGTSLAKIKSGEILGEMSFIEEEAPMVKRKGNRTGHGHINKLRSPYHPLQGMPWIRREDFTRP